MIARKTTIFVGVSLLALVLWNCSPDKKMKKAFDQGQYQRVINYYLQQVAKEPGNGKDVLTQQQISEGRSLVRLLYEEPKSGTAGSRVNFIHPKDAGGVLVELVQPGEGH